MKFISKVFFVFLFSILIFSCQNFLGGSELKQKLDKVIEIASSEDLSVEINLRNPRSGSVTPSGVTKVKKVFLLKLNLRSKMVMNLTAFLMCLKNQLEKHQK